MNTECTKVTNAPQSGSASAACEGHEDTAPEKAQTAGSADGNSSAHIAETQKQRSYDQGFCTAAGAMSVAPSASKGHLRQLFNDADRV